MKLLRLLFLLIATGSAYYYFSHKNVEQTLYLSSNFTDAHEAKEFFSRNKPTILWDIHSVLFKKNRFLYVQGLWNIQNKWNFAISFGKNILSPSAISNIYHQSSRGTLIAQAYFSPIKNNDPKFYKEIIKLTNASYQPDKNVYEIVSLLKEEEYDQYLFSNIGPEPLLLLQKDYPRYFNQFNTLINSINSTTPEKNNWIWKPQRKSYEKVLRYVDRKAHMTIFIDDNIHNVEEAQKNGVTSILFISARQLKNDLNKILEIE